MPHTIVLDSLNKASGPLAPVVKEYLLKAEEELRARHLAGEAGREVCRAYTIVIDNLLKALFSHKKDLLAPNDTAALVALKGDRRAGGSANSHSIFVSLP